MADGLARRKTLLAVAAFVVLVIAYPIVIPGNYPLGVGITAGAMAAGTVGFVLLFGYAQQLALGQAGFCMVGGYANAASWESARAKATSYAAWLQARLVRLIRQSRLLLRNITNTSTIIFTPAMWISCGIWLICGSRIHALL